MNRFSLCVFCGARNEVDDSFLKAGRAFGQWLAENHIRLVFGGGDCGMMGAVSNAAMSAGGEVVGVFPEHLRSHEIAHKNITHLHFVGSMHERKKMMFDLSDAFAVLPGGFGTMDEMMEILTWHQIGLHDKPLFIFNQNGYWNPLVAMMEKAIEERFARPANRDYFTVHDTLETLSAAILKEKTQKPAQK